MKTKILTFDSMYIIQPIRKVYLALINTILNEKNSRHSRLILYRLDKDNVFISDYRNISGMIVGTHQVHIDALSIKFYRYIEKSGSCDTLSINNVPLYQLYPRQIKLKLAGVLKCALRIRNVSNDSKENIEIITDKQTVAIIKVAFLFLDYTPTNIIWKTNGLLTSCITINSFIMRFAAIVKMYISPSKYPNEYFYKHVNSNAPTVLITAPIIRPKDFFSLYVENFNSQFNIILYSLKSLDTIPNIYKKINIERATGVLQGIFNIKNLCWSSDSYIADIILIFSRHADLSMSVDVVNSIFTNQIDAHISRLQTNAIDTHLAVEARRRGIFILGDIEEEIFYCDSAVIPSMSENTESVKFALANGGKVAYKNSNSMMKHRFMNFNEKNIYYLHDLLGVDRRKKIIFYASDPSKEESQRYLTEKFLINYFSNEKQFILAIKTHMQDNGNVTNNAYLDTTRPSNVILIGDITQGNKIISKKFNVFKDFDFNAAVASSDGFLTASSSTILQALVLGVKNGIVDIFNNGFYDYLIIHKATMLINSEKSLRYFLENKKLNISDDTLSYCGLKNYNEKFNIGAHLLKCMKEFDRNNENKQRKGK